MQIGRGAIAKVIDEKRAFGGGIGVEFFEDSVNDVHGRGRGDDERIGAVIGDGRDMPRMLAGIEAADRRHALTPAPASSAACIAAAGPMRWYHW